MDSNWTEPWLFMVYSVVKPVAGAFILVLMYTVFAFIGNRPDPAAFSYMYVGNSFFIFVGSVLFGTFQVIQSDREWYQTIRYVYISPISYYVYIVGRAVSKVGVAAFAVAITLAGYSDLTIMALLVVSSVAFFGLSLLIFKTGEYFARKAGKIDMTTSY